MPAAATPKILGVSLRVFRKAYGHRARGGRLKRTSLAILFTVAVRLKGMRYGQRMTMHHKDHLCFDVVQVLRTMHRESEVSLRRQVCCKKRKPDAGQEITKIKSVDDDCFVLLSTVV